MTSRRLPLTRLPDKQDLVLFLIKEELKSRKLFHAFHTIQMDDCWFQPHLDSLIMRTIDLDHSDETFIAYDDILDRRSKKIDGSNDSVMKQAMKVYLELITLKKGIESKERRQ